MTEEQLMNECVEEARQPDNRFDLRDVERVLAIRLGDRKRARKMVRAWDRKMTIRPTAEVRAWRQELLRLWERPEYADCKTVDEVLVRRRHLARN